MTWTPAPLGRRSPPRTSAATARRVRPTAIEPFAGGARAVELRDLRRRGEELEPPDRVSASAFFGPASRTHGPTALRSPRLLALTQDGDRTADRAGASRVAQTARGSDCRVHRHARRRPPKRVRRRPTTFPRAPIPPRGRVSVQQRVVGRST